MLTYASMMEGRRKVSLDAGRKTATKIPEARVKDVPPWGNVFFAVPIFAMTRFGEWDAIVKEPKPDEKFKFTQAMWHYSRALAYTRRNQPKEAAEERDALEQMRADPSLKELQAGANAAPKLVDLAALVADGEMAASRREWDKAISSLQEAVALQDSFTYNEPEDWYYPVRHSLGAVLIDAGRQADAEMVYHEDLRRNPENGWSLYGLLASLRAQGKHEEAVQVDERFRKAWARSDVTPTASRF
jgi:tetratricopeptide (TPR) repeat protein